MKRNIIHYISMNEILNKIDLLITCDRAIVYSRIFFLILVSLIIFEGTINFFFLSGQDFRSFYGAGQIFLEGKQSELYNADTQRLIQAELGFHEETGWPLALFLNPPVFAWGMQLFALLPYTLALFIWRLISVIVAAYFIAIIIKYLKITVKWWDVLIFLLASLPGLSTIFNGQNTFFFLSLYAAAFLMLKRNLDYTAGALIGLGFLKPQLFWFMPLIFIFQRKLKFMAGFAFTLLFLLFASIYLVGFNGMLEYLSLLNSIEYRQFVNLRVFDMHSLSAFVSLLVGNEINQILFLSTSVSIAAATIIYLKFYDLSLDLTEIFTISILLTILTSPHLFHYDLSILILPYIFMYSWTKEPNKDHDVSRNLRLLMVLLYISLWISLFTIHFIRVQISVPIIFFLLIVTFQRLNKRKFLCSYE